MMTYSFSDQGDVPTLRIDGSLAAMTVVEIRPTIDRIVDMRLRRVVVDLSALSLIDSSGVGAVVSLYKRMRETGGQVQIIGVRDQPLAVFRLLGLDRIFTL
jgi:anti-sigma B factor antagonist